MMDHDHVIGKYIHLVLETGHPPASVYSFARELEVEERQFYEHFASLEAVESEIWRRSVTDTIHAISQGEDWEGFGAQQKLLTFY